MMSLQLKWLVSLCLVVSLFGCSESPPVAKPQNESAQGLEAPAQGSDTKSESEPSSGSGSR